MEVLKMDIIKKLESLFDLITPVEKEFQKRKISCRKEFIMFSYLQDVKDILRSIIAIYSSNSFFGVDSLNRSLFERLIYAISIIEHPKLAETFHLKMLVDINLMLDILDNKDHKRYKSLVSELELSDNEVGDYISKVTSEAFTVYTRENIYEYYKSKFSYDVSKRCPGNLKWYSLTKEISSLKELSDSIGYLEYYNKFYGALSKEAHGNLYNKRIQFKDAKSLISRNKMPKFNCDTRFNTYYLTLQLLYAIYEGLELVTDDFEGHLIFAQS